MFLLPQPARLGIEAVSSFLGLTPAPWRRNSPASGSATPASLAADLSWGLFSFSVWMWRVCGVRLVAPTQRTPHRVRVRERFVTEYKLPYQLAGPPEGETPCLVSILYPPDGTTALFATSTAEV